MNGKGIGQLSVYRISANNESHLMWNKSGDHGNRWNFHSMHFNTASSYQVSNLLVSSSLLAQALNDIFHVELVLVQLSFIYRIFILWKTIIELILS